MKWIFLLTGFIFISGCTLRQRQMELNKKLNQLNQRQQELDLKEEALFIKEQKLNEREKRLDSTTGFLNDSLFTEHEKLSGKWMVEMECTETNCPGSAVGDVKTEYWDFKIQENQVFANALSNKRLVKIYEGYFNGNILRLTAQQDPAEENAKIDVHLQKIKDNEMAGERQVRQANGCRILYSLSLKKI